MLMDRKIDRLSFGILGSCEKSNILNNLTISQDVLSKLAKYVSKSVANILITLWGRHKGGKPNFMHDFECTEE